MYFQYLICIVDLHLGFSETYKKHRGSEIDNKSRGGQKALPCDKRIKWEEALIAAGLKRLQMTSRWISFTQHRSSALSTVYKHVVTLRHKVVQKNNSCAAISAKMEANFHKVAGFCPPIETMKKILPQKVAKQAL